jgi:nitrile hydratase accessory protein
VSDRNVPAFESDDPVAPPRSNGELIFEAPWQSRIFGLTIALYERGAFQWPEFQRRLIDAIAAWEADNPNTDNYPYYDCWLTAFESLAEAKGLYGSLEVDDRERTYAARPHGHDHDHD